MGFTMDSAFLHIAAFSAVTVVALFPSPATMVDALDPTRDNARVFFEPTRNNQEIRVEIPTTRTTRVRSVEIPDLGTCQYDLSQAELAMVRDCHADLLRIASEPTPPGRIVPEQETARLALVRLCQAQWATLDNRADVIPPEACASLR